MTKPNNKRRLGVLRERVQYLDKKAADRESQGLSASYPRAEASAINEAIRRWEVYEKIRDAVFSARRVRDSDCEDEVLSAADVLAQVEEALGV